MRNEVKPPYSNSHKKPLLQQKWQGPHFKELAVQRRYFLLPQITL